MATKKEEEVVVEMDRGEEYVDFQIPLSGPDAKPVLIGVNGEFIRVRPGEPVQVKRKFVEAYMHAKQQEREAWKTQTRAQNASKKALADL